MAILTGRATLETPREVIEHNLSQRSSQWPHPVSDLVLLNLYSRFLSLPVEIRVQIWWHSEYAIAPRFVPVSLGDSTASPCDNVLRSDLVDSPGSITVSKPPVPPNLHACQESRYEALRHYQKLYTFGDNYRYVYINGSKDALLMSKIPDYMTSNSTFPRPSANVFSSPGDVSVAGSIQTLAIPQCLFSDLQPRRSPRTRTVTTRTTTSSHRFRTQDIFSHMLKLLPALRHIIVVALPNDKRIVSTGDRAQSPSPLPTNIAQASSSPWSTMCCLTEPTIRNRYAERRLRDAMDLVSFEHDPIRGARPLPTWSIRTASSCSGRCTDTIALPGNPNKIVESRDDDDNDDAWRPCTTPRQCVETPITSGRASCSDHDEEEDIQRLPASWQSYGGSKSFGLASVAPMETSSSPLSSSTTTTSTQDSRTLSGSPRRCGWSLAEVPGTSGILDFAASRLAFYRRYHYWS